LPPDSASGVSFREGYPVVGVAAFVAGMRDVLRDVFPFIWVRGEITGLKRSAQGHTYFSLREGNASVACAFFRGSAARSTIHLTEGMDALVGGTPDIYGERGNLQLIVRSIEDIGEGALAKAVAALKARLEAEGLFAVERKRPLPRLPRRVGVATSPSGAVIRDILQVSARRHPGIDIVVAPTRVQGDGAAEEVAAAVGILDARDDIDVIIVARGGGSTEDLLAFNSEVVVRAVAACRLPVVSAVGHETDISLCDLAADLRAPTPSAAAELVFPDREVLREDIEAAVRRARRTIDQRLTHARLLIDRAAARLPHPRRRIEQQMQTLDDRDGRLHMAMRRRLERRDDRLAAAVARLEGASPLRSLARGWVLAVDGDGRPRTSVRQLQAGDRLSLRFRDGRADVLVEDTHADAGVTS
jgi:exodeoxyribonuclease VII large subunit